MLQFAALGFTGDVDVEAAEAAAGGVLAQAIRKFMVPCPLAQLPLPAPMMPDAVAARMSVSDG